MDRIRLRFPEHDQDELVLDPGLHGIGLRDGAVAADGGDEAPVQLCIDRRGVWMTLAEGARPVHVNGRPVRRLAMLRVGDAIHVEGVLVQLVGASDVPRRVPEAGGAAHPPAAAEARLQLRGVGGQHHGRCFDLSRPRVVGRLGDCDIRIDGPAFAERHARLEPHGDAVVLRGLAPDGASVVNGERVHDALLRSGDQVVFDAHHRFVVESPGRPPARAEEAGGIEPRPEPAPQAPSARLRVPWLLLAALLLAAALAALLLFGAA